MTHGIKKTANGWFVFDTSEPDCGYSTSSKSDAERFYFIYLNVLGFDSFDAYERIHDVMQKFNKKRRKKK